MTGDGSDADDHGDDHVDDDGHHGGPGDRRYEAGLRVRREVLGDEHVERATAAATDLDAAFQRHITEVAWGSLWTRDEALDRRTRSCITIALLSALRAEGELALHIRAGVRNGLTPAEIAEVILHTSAYAGIPAANAAMAVAKEVLRGYGDGVAGHTEPA